MLRRDGPARPVIMAVPVAVAVAVAVAVPVAVLGPMIVCMVMHVIWRLPRRGR